MRLAEIHVYPLKGARGISLARADVLAGGLRHDRRFMILAADGAFVTQRSHPRLALIETALSREALTLRTPGGAVALPLSIEGPRTAVRVWDDDTEGVDAGEGAADLVSTHLGEPCTVVFMPDDVIRPVEAPHGAPGDRVGFADAYPVLLATRASLTDLNARLPAPVPMSRFRPNLVVEGGEAFEEERYGRVRIGAMALRMPKRCSRCKVTTVDQDTAEVGKEPLRTLASYRAEGNNVYFAQNLIPDGEGSVAVGDDVTYLERREAP
ncbi:MAG: MOSC domain-containing protein [Labilithrix sp.]|nr:MOSC domain-containing protein [Labilithrix sp.]